MCAEKYNETLDFLFNALPVWERVADGAAYKPGTERVAEFAAAVGNPHERIKTVHIAGTNGKGSTASMLAAILQSAGYRTGLYTSPHLVDFRERIRVNGAMIPEAAVVEFTQTYRAEMVRLEMTFFEMATVMAFWFFARSGVDVAVIETGLGGRHDATNIITPLVSVITNIGLEHTKYLGADVGAIAAEKAGIIKPGVPVVIGESGCYEPPRADSSPCHPERADSSPCHPERAAGDEGSPARVFRAAAASQGSPITFADFPLLDKEGCPKGGEVEMDLPGVYQQKNAKTVLAAIDQLRKNLTISEEAVRAGLANTAKLTGLRGRWEVLQTRPTVVVDTAHNAHGFEQIARQLALWRADNPAGRIWMVLGFAADKDVTAIAATLPSDAHLILTAADSPRSMPVAELARHFSLFASRLSFAPRPFEQARLPSACRRVTFRFSLAFSVAEAVARALACASETDLVYIGGSNFVVGEFLKSC